MNFNVKVTWKDESVTNFEVLADSRSEAEQNVVTIIDGNLQYEIKNIKANETLCLGSAPNAST